MMRKASGIASAVTTLRTRRGVHPLLVRARPALWARNFSFDDPRPLLGAGPDQVTFELGDRRKDVESARPAGSMGSHLARACLLLCGEILVRGNSCVSDVHGERL